MKDLNGDDILTLSFIPLMGSKESRSKRSLQIDVIAIDIFDFESINDLEKYL